MKVYHYLPSEFALDDLRERRLKVACLNELNDPLDLTPALPSSDPDCQQALTILMEDMVKNVGILCFSKCWNSILMWSHYADKHKGMCLGFEIHGGFTKVQYAEDRPDICKLVQDINKQVGQGRIDLGQIPVDGKEAILKILRSKFVGWSYEEEIRAWVSLNKKESGMYFFDFCGALKLTEVIVGPLCDVTKKEVETALANDKSEIKITKAKLADDKYSIVKANSW